MIRAIDETGATVRVCQTRTCSTGQEKHGIAMAAVSRTWGVSKVTNGINSAHPLYVWEKTGPLLAGEHAHPGGSVCQTVAARALAQQPVTR